MHKRCVICRNESSTYYKITNGQVAETGHALYSARCFRHLLDLASVPWWEGVTEADYIAYLIMSG